MGSFPKVPQRHAVSATLKGNAHMSIAAAFAVPHPTIVVPGVGRGEQEKIPDTTKAIAEVGRRVALLKPDAVVIFSPHATSYCDYIHISPGTGSSGNFAPYGDPDTIVGTAYDQRLVRVIYEEVRKAGLHAGTSGERIRELDHGTMIPLHAIQEAGLYAPIVRVGTSDLSTLEHYRFGICVRNAAEKLGRRIVVIASGDLSHKIRHSSPYGYAKEGPQFDRIICTALASGDFGALFTIDPKVAERAAQCCLIPLIMMAGTLDGMMVTSELLSYEGSIGVGYAVAEFMPLSGDTKTPSRMFGAEFERRERARQDEVRSREDSYVSLARRAVEHWVSTGHIPSPENYLSWNLPDELTQTRAGAFVTIKRGDVLRGCVGTLEPTRATLADEIVRNAVMACSRDQRFPSVTVQELLQLTYQVDVLGEPQIVYQANELDPTRFGVIVSTPDGRRGSLMPDQEGVYSGDEQIALACKRGGIDANERYTVQRFMVTRHGGAQ